MGKIFTEFDKNTFSSLMKDDAMPFFQPQPQISNLKASLIEPIRNIKTLNYGLTDSANPSTSENSPTYLEKQKELFDFASQNLKKCSQVQLLIDVKPKRKTFQTEEDKKKFIDGFTQKKKTELCKNWELNGSCRYGNNCSFAHGKSELKSKTHLNSNYKQKPCKQFLLKGYCCYGNRCQYLHREIKYYPEHKDFLINAQKKNGLALKSLVNFISEVSLLKKMEKNYEKVKDIGKFLLGEKKNENRRRLPIFSMITLASN